MFDSTGGGIDQTAVIGHPPEHRDWKTGDHSIQPVISHTARVEAYVTVDRGILRATRIGARTWLMKRVHVGHDALIGTDCELSPGVIVGGHVHIGDGTRVGMGAIFRPGVTIGEGVYIGCGSVVVCDVPAGEVWVGNPARKLRTVEGLKRDSPEDLRTIASA